MARAAKAVLDPWTDGEREAWRIPDGLTVSQWAERYRMLSRKDSARPGLWSNDLTPYLVGIQDAFSDPEIEEVTFVKPTQVGGTEAMLNFLGWIISQDPGPTMVVYPTEPIAKKASQTRVIPMIEQSPDLRAHIPKNRDDLSFLSYVLDSMNLFFSWANSPSALASFPIRYLIMDEEDKYPVFSGKEADPSSLAIERTKTFRGMRKICRASTPALPGGPILRAYAMSDRRRFWVPCPHCGARQLLLFPNLHWPKGETANRIRSHGLAWLECVECNRAIYERDKLAMLRAGEWRRRGAKGSHAGFWINALYSPFCTWSEVVAKFLESKGNFSTLQNFTNSWLGEAFERQISAVGTRSVAAIRNRGGLPRYEVPNEAQMLTAFIDWHGPKKGYYFSVIAWGANRRGWLVHHGQVFNEADLDFELFERDYRSADGRKWNIFATGVDSGDGARAHEVYAYAQKRYPRVRPTKGKQSMTMPCADFSIDYTHKQSGRKFKGFSGVWINTTYFKDAVASMIKQDEAESRDHDLLHFCADVSAEWLRALRSEHKVREKSGREVWVPKTEGISNHPWDTIVGCLAMAERFGLLKLRRKTGPAERTANAPAPEPVKPEPIPLVRQSAPKAAESGMRSVNMRTPFVGFRRR